jgi:hypothetical protein
MVSTWGNSSTYPLPTLSPHLEICRYTWECLLFQPI